MDNIIRFFKQLLPLSYNTTYEEEGKKYVSIWKMFLYKCYDVHTYEIVKEI